MNDAVLPLGDGHVPERLGAARTHRERAPVGRLHFPRRTVITDQAAHRPRLALIKGERGVEARYRPLLAGSIGDHHVLLAGLRRRAAERNEQQRSLTQAYQHGALHAAYRLEWARRIRPGLAHVL